MGIKNMAQLLLYILSTKTNFITLPNPPLHEAPSDASQKGLFLSHGNTRTKITPDPGYTV